MNNFDPHIDLTCYLLPTKTSHCHPNFSKIYQQSFAFWFTFLKQALEEEGNFEVSKHLSSDMFVECDEFVVIFHNNSPIGIFMFRWLDITFQANQLLSSVKERFPAVLFEKLESERNTNIMIMSNLVVHPEWRRSKTGLRISDLLVKFAINRFLESKADVLLTTTRNNRSTNALGCRQGGIKYADNVAIFGVPSDILIFYRDRVTPHPIAEINSIANTLWKNKMAGWIPTPLHFKEENYEYENFTS